MFNRFISPCQLNNFPSFFLLRGRGGDSSGSEAEEFDQSAAFFTQVVSKKKKGSSVATEPTAPAQRTVVRPTAEARLNGNQEEKVEDLDPVILRSRQLASKYTRYFPFH